MAFENVRVHSLRNAGSPVDGYREDLAAGDVVSLSLTSTVGVTSCRWQIVGRPEGSNAGGVGPEPVVLATSLTASFTVDADDGAFRKDGTYKVEAVLNPGTPSETRVDAILARLSGLTIPGPSGSTLQLRRPGGFEALEDTSDPHRLQGWATQLLRWLAWARIHATGGGGGGTLAQDYLAGAGAADQTLALSDAAGGGIVINGGAGGFTGASALRVNTAAGGPMVIDRATGRVGIGTAAPLKDLHVASTAPTLRLQDTNGVTIDVQNDGNALSFLAGATTLAVLPSTGGVQTTFGVGINAAAPAQPVLALGAGSAAPVSAAGQGWLRFNELTGHLEVSEGTGAWTPLIGGAASAAFYVVTRATSAPVNAVNLGALTTGLVKSTVAGAVSTLSIAAAGTDFQAPLAAADATIAFPTASTVRVGVLSQKFVVEGAGPDAQLPNAQFTGALATGLLKNTTATGVLSIAAAGADFQAPLSAADATIAFPTATTVKVGVLPDKFIVQGTADAALSGAQFLGALPTGLLKNTNTTGVLSIAAAGTDFPAVNATYWVSSSASAPPSAVNLGALSTGLLKETVAGGVATPSIAAPNVDFPAVNATYVVTAAVNAPPSAANLGALTSGLLKQTVAGAVATLAIATPGTDYVTQAYVLVKDSAGAALAQRSNLKFAARLVATDAAPDTVVDLAASGVAAGAYDTVLVDAFGRVTSGGTSVVANVTALEALSPATFTDGDDAWVSSVGAPWVFFSNSTLPVDHITVASVSGNASARWLRRLVVNPAWGLVRAWSVNTSTGSDEADGTIAPLRSLAEVSRRVWKTTYGYTDSLPTIVSLTGDDTVGAYFDITTVGVATNGNHTIRQADALFMIVGQPTQLVTGTISGAPVTATLGSTGPVSAFSDAALPSSFAASGLTATNVLFHRTSGTECWWWGAEETTPRTMAISQPLGRGVASVPTLANGDSYEAVALPKIKNVAFNPGKNASLQISLVQDTSTTTSRKLSNILWGVCSGPRFSDGQIYNCRDWAGPTDSGAVTGSVIGGLVVGTGATLVTLASSQFDSLGLETGIFTTFYKAALAAIHDTSVITLSANFYGVTVPCIQFNHSHNHIEVWQVGGSGNTDVIVKIGGANNSLAFRNPAPDGMTSSAAKYQIYGDVITSGAALPFYNLAAACWITNDGGSIPAFLTQAYSTVKNSAGVAQTQRSNLKFSANFAVADAAPDTTVELSATGVVAGTYNILTVDAFGRVTAAAAVPGAAAYSTVDAAGTPLAQRSVLNFSSAFTAVDNAGATRTDVDLANVGPGVGTIGGAGSAVQSVSLDAKGRVTAAAVTALFYQLVEDQAGAALTRRPTLQFLADFSTADDAGSGRTQVALSATGVGAGTYRSVTVDAKGRVTAGTNPAHVETFTTQFDVPFVGATPFNLTEDAGHFVYETDHGRFLGISTAGPGWDPVHGAISSNVSNGVLGIDLYTPTAPNYPVFTMSGGAGQIIWNPGARGADSEAAMLTVQDASVGANTWHLQVFTNKAGTAGTFSANNMFKVAEFYAGTGGASGVMVALGGIGIGNAAHGTGGAGSEGGIYDPSGGVGLVLQRDDASAVAPATGASGAQASKVIFTAAGGVPRWQLSVAHSTAAGAAYADMLTGAEGGAITAASVPFAVDRARLTDDPVNFTYDGVAHLLTAHHLAIPNGGSAALTLTQGSTQRISKTGGVLSIFTDNTFGMLLGTDGTTRLNLQANGSSLFVGRLGINGDADPLGSVPGTVGFAVVATATRDTVYFGVGGIAIPDSATRAYLDVTPAAAGTPIAAGVAASGLHTVRFRQQNYTLGAGASATSMSTLLLDGPPQIGGVNQDHGNGGYALLVLTGDAAFFNGQVDIAHLKFRDMAANAGGIVGLGSTGPSGVSVNPAEWLVVENAAGQRRAIPAWSIP